MRHATAMRWMWLGVLGGCGPVMSSGADAGRGPLSVTTIDAGCAVRTVITPDPLIPEPIVAVAWGFVYRAQCVDLPSLQDFMRSHYAHAPEDECANGVTRF